jgi:hypothetical protein
MGNGTEGEKEDMTSPESSKDEVKEKAADKKRKAKFFANAEKRLAKSLSVEDLRTSGLVLIENGQWMNALFRLQEAVYHGVRDTQTLDALGEALHQTRLYELFLLHEELFREPRLAVHAVRCLYFLGAKERAKEYLRVAEPGMLKDALEIMLNLPKDIGPAIDHLFQQPLDHFEKLTFAEFWQLFAPVAEVAGPSRRAALLQAERKLKGLAYDRPVIHFNQSLRFLKEQQFLAGWRLYEWRLVPGSPCFHVSYLADIPVWEGENLGPESCLLVQLENGWGDQIFSLRFAKQVQETTQCRLSLLVEGPLFELVKASFPEATVYLKKPGSEPSDVEPQQKHYWCFAFSIPSRLYLDRPVQTEGFLTAPSSELSVVHAKLEKLNTQKKRVLSMTWHGDIRTAPMRTRAYSVEEFLSLVLLQEKNPASLLIVSLQKDITTEERAFLENQSQKKGFTFFDAGSDLADFAKTAAWLQSADHVFSCDTAVAHLAGALARPMTTFIRNPSIWHWAWDPQTGYSVWNGAAKVHCALAPAIPYMFDL